MAYVSLLAPDLAAAPPFCPRCQIGGGGFVIVSLGRRLIGGPRAEGALLEVLNLRRRPGLPVVVVALVLPAEVDNLRPAECTQPSVVALALDDLAVTAGRAHVDPRPCFARLSSAVLLLAGWHALAPIRRALLLWAAPNALDAQLGVLRAGNRGVRLWVPGAGLSVGLGRALVRGEEAGLGEGRSAGSRGVRLRVRRGNRRHDGHVGEEGVKHMDAMGPFAAIESANSDDTSMSDTLWEI